MNARRVAAGVAGGAALIAAVTVLARVVGFGRQLVFQGSVGATLVGDVYTSINALPNVVFEIVAGGALAGAVVPLLSAAVGRGDTAQVRQTTSALLGWTLAVLVPVALLGVVLAGPVAEAVLAGKGGAAGVETGRSMLLLFLPQIPLYGLAVVTAGVLQAHRRFLAAALAPVLSSLVVAGAYLAFASVFTGDPDQLDTLDRRSELVLAGGTTLGVLVLALATLVPALVRVGGLQLTLRFPPGIAARARGLALAGLAGLVAQQLAYLASYILSNRYAGTGGTVTYLNSWMVYLLPYAVLAAPIATAAFPRLAEYAEDGRGGAGPGEPGEAGPGGARPGGAASDRYARTLARTTRAVVVVSALGTAMLVAAAWPVARFFGLLDPGDSSAAPMAWALVAFAPGLIGYGLVAHLGRALFARGQGRAAAVATVIGWLAVVVVAVAGSGQVDAGRVTAVLGAAHTVGMSLAAVLLLRAVLRDAGRHALAGLPRTLVGALVAAGVGGGVGWWVAGLFGQSADQQGMGTVLVSGLASGLAAAVVGAAVLALVDRNELRAVLRR